MPQPERLYLLDVYGRRCKSTTALLSSEPQYSRRIHLNTTVEPASICQLVLEHEPRLICNFSSQPMETRKQKV